MAALVQAVVVLYKRPLAGCESLTSLLAVLEERPDWAAQFRVLIYDNSPEPMGQDTASVTYIHDPGNSGLAAAYNVALAQAEQAGCAWLLLLDQDTLLTAAFVGELLEVAARVPERVGAIVPKLLVNGEMHSPAPNFLREVRTMRNPGKSAYLDATGAQPGHLVAYNSGSALRVTGLRAMGGFPAEYWLDYLDHAVFHQLCARGYQVYLLRARLVHDFSTSDAASVPAWRQLNVLAARSLYVQQHGSVLERLLYRIWLLRHARSLRRSGADAAVWKKTALAAIWFVGKNKR